MSMWEKLREELIKAFQRTEELVKTGADKLKEAGERLGSQGSFLAELARLKTELHALQQRKNDAFRKLGQLYFQLSRENRLGVFQEEAAEWLQLLSELEQEEQALIQQKHQLEEEYRARGVEVNTIEALVEDLEAGEASIESVTIAPDSPARGKPLKDLPLPREVLISLVVRGEEVIIPRGDTIVQPGDRLSLLGKKEALQQALALFEKKPPTTDA